VFNVSVQFIEPAVPLLFLSTVYLTVKGDVVSATEE
jgi:hypothetical protein